MVQKLYSVYDSKASYFLTPWPCRNDGMARREFAGVCSNPDSPMGKFPADFVLFQVGEYDDHDAKLTSAVPPVRLCDGVEVLQIAKGA